MYRLNRFYVAEAALPPPRPLAPTPKSKAVRTAPKITPRSSPTPTASKPTRESAASNRQREKVEAQAKAAANAIADKVSRAPTEMKSTLKHYFKEVKQEPERAAELQELTDAINQKNPDWGAVDHIVNPNTKEPNTPLGKIVRLE